jgi:hypothetical protein
VKIKEENELLRARLKEVEETHEELIKKVG